MTNEMNSTQRKWKVNISVGDTVFPKFQKKLKVPIKSSKNFCSKNLIVPAKFRLLPLPHHIIRNIDPF